MSKVDENPNLGTIGIQSNVRMIFLVQHPMALTARPCRMFKTSMRSPDDRECLVWFSVPCQPATGVAAVAIGSCNKIERSCLLEAYTSTSRL